MAVKTLYQVQAVGPNKRALNILADAAEKAAEYYVRACYGNDVDFRDWAEDHLELLAPTIQVEVLTVLDKAHARASTGLVPDGPRAIFVASDLPEIKSALNLREETALSL